MLKDEKMTNKSNISLFQDHKIRYIWDEEIEEYYFSVIDVVGALSKSKNPRKYWSVLKTRLNKEGVEVATICSQLKMHTSDGKLRKTDVATKKQLFRIIQSIPSPNAEPFKQWLAQVGSERVDEIADPEIAIERAISTYRKKGYSEDWITQRIRSIEVRKDLTAEWDRSGVEEGLEYAILTNEISKASFGITTGEHKKVKGLRKESLRDNMTNAELVIICWENWLQLKSAKLKILKVLMKVNLLLLMEALLQAMLEGNWKQELERKLSAGKMLKIQNYWMKNSVIKF